MTAPAPDAYSALKENIRTAVLTTIERYNERVHSVLLWKIHAELATEIAENVVTEVIEKEKTPRKFDAEVAMLKVYIDHARLDGLENRGAEIDFFQKILPHLATAALSSPTPGEDK